MKRQSLFLLCLTLLLLILFTACTTFPPNSKLQNTENSGDSSFSTLNTITSGDHTGVIEVNGLKRTYLLHIPPGYDDKSQMPLILVSHGGGGNATNIATTTGFTSLSDREGFIVVYPNGTGRFWDDKLLTWNTGNCCGYALDNNIDDIEFIRTLLDALQQNLSIDPARIYATGISNGAMMSYLIGCEFSERIAAIAPVAGTMGMESCNPEQPVSVIIFHGTEDEHVLYNGGRPLKQADRHYRIDKSVAYCTDFWIKANSCNPVSKTETAGNIRKDTYTGGKDKTEVVLYTILGGKHAWPGGSKGYARGDTPTNEISATDIIWNFFQSHSKQKILASFPPKRNTLSDSPIKRMTTLVSRGAKTLDWSYKTNQLTVEKYGLDTYVDIYVMNPDSSGEQCLTCNKVECPQKHNGNSDWHPSGNYIVFTAEKKNNPAALWRQAVPGSGFNNDLWLMTADGQQFYQLTNYPLHTRAVIHPHFSHDGNKLFWSERLGKSSGSEWGEWVLLVADFDLSGTRPVIKNTKPYQPGRNHYFYESHAFSPDDRYLLFAANPDGQADYGFDIYTLNIASGELNNLTQTPGDWDEHAQYSPDGSKIAWMSASGLNIPEGSIEVASFEKGLITELWIMDADGSKKNALPTLTNLAILNI